MCGISGFLGRFDSSILTLMNNAISHRGPDDVGVYFSAKDSIGLAHRRLSIIDLSSDGRQPMWDLTKTVSIVFNGEIYNYRELRDELQKDGFQFKSRSDTEVILNLYLRDGTDLLDNLNGIFAFAIWDPRSGTLFAARDGVGVKPFYFSETPKGFVFSSEIKAILQESSVIRELDCRAIHHYLTYLWSPAPGTILKHVKKLEPGHALLVKEGTIKKCWQYYDLPYDQPIQNLAEEEAIEQVRCHLSRAIKRQMVSDVPIGAFLSGGLDSSAIVALSRKNLSSDQCFRCFTIGFNDGSFKKEGMADDLPYAQKVADHLGIDLHTVYVGPEMANQLEKMIYHLDEPQADPAPLNALFISELAKQTGIKVLLSGAGGDDIFGGYRRHYALYLERYWKWLPKFFRKRISAVSWSLPQRSSVTRRVSKALQYAELDDHERLVSYFYWARPEVIRNLYSRDFVNEIDKDEQPDPLISSLQNLDSHIPSINKMLYLEGKHFLPDHNLNYTDKMGMATGVEVRVPFLDPDLIALAARLPVKFKQNGKEGKWILKRAMESYLPNDVIYRPKTGFGVPLRSWLRKEMLSLVKEVLSKNAVENRGLFDYESIKRLLENDRIGRVDGTYTIFSLICIELWCRIFIDQPTPEKIN